MHQQKNWAAFCHEQLEQRVLFSKAPLFQVSGLVSDTPSVPAAHTDANAVNAWGLANGPGTKIWVADNGASVSSVYNADGTVDPLVVSIPPPNGASGVPSTPTGEVYNGTTSFDVQAGKPALFIFATENGTISAWSPTADATHAILKVDNYDSGNGAVYKGLATGSFNGHDYLYATNFHSGKVEIYDTDFNVAHLNGSFRDSKIPAGYSPFGIQNINGLIYVTYAAQDLYGQSDVRGKGHGYLDVFLPDGSLDHRLVRRGTLNSPWGITRIPGGFGAYKRDIAVGNFGDGLIQVFDPKTGLFKGYLRKAKNGHVIQISGLWGLTFGNGGPAGSAKDLYFTAGPNGETDGLLGKLTLVTPAASSAISIHASSLSPAESNQPLFADKDIISQLLPDTNDAASIIS